VMLEEQGLLAAVDWHLGVFQKQTGIEVDYAGPSAVPELEADAAVHVYRILQEALNNVARHAQAGRARVRLAVVEGELELTVSDDGRGIPAGARPGVGLAGMRERAALLGGQLEVGPGATAGTEVRLSLSLQGELKEAPRG
jgi:signal transduction histidine kinase